MEGKLFKMVEGYTLSLTGSIDDLYGISNKQLADDHGLNKLSLEHCEAIANGYDLEELACDKIGIDISVVKHIDRKVIEKNESPTTPIHEAGALGASLYHMVKGFEIGFQKALEILGDKKYTDDDIVDAYMAGHIRGMSTDMGEDNIHPICSEYLNSLQKTEWDVEVEQELIQSSIQGDAIWELKKDTDGCLILRRI
jgi:hypothetical protein